MSLEAEMSTDIVTVTPCIDFSYHWSCSRANSFETRWHQITRLFSGIPMHLISNDAKADLRNKVCAQLSILDLRRWSGNGHYSHRSGSKVYSGNDYWTFNLFHKSNCRWNFKIPVIVTTVNFQSTSMGVMSIPRPSSKIQDAQLRANFIPDISLCVIWNEMHRNSWKKA